MLAPHLQETLESLAAGETAREMADRLHISTNTVKSRLKTLYRQLGARDQAHAVALAFRLGVLGAPGALNGSGDSPPGGAPSRVMRPVVVGALNSEKLRATIAELTALLQLAEPGARPGAGAAGNASGTGSGSAAGSAGPAGGGAAAPPEPPPGGRPGDPVPDRLRRALRRVADLARHGTVHPRDAAAVLDRIARIAEAAAGTGHTLRLVPSAERAAPVITLDAAARPLMKSERDRHRYVLGRAGPTTSIRSVPYPEGTVMSGFDDRTGPDIQAGFDIRDVSLAALNSLTKYPSIPTYHVLDPRNGGLTEEVTAFTGPVIGTEKVDGTSSRIIVLPDGGYLIGSREELLYARGDLIGNPALGIVENLRPVAETLTGALPGEITVFYLELYGGRIGGQAKQYSARGATGWRLFDVAVIGDLDERLGWAPEQISRWRDGSGQPFLGEPELRATAASAGLELTPRLFTVDAAELPTEVAAMRAFLGERLPGTLVALDDTGLGAAEGVVLRTADRSVIAKARFQDYDRTLKRRANAAPRDR